MPHSGRPSHIVTEKNLHAQQVAKAHGTGHPKAAAHGEKHAEKGKWEVQEQARRADHDTWAAHQQGHGH